MKIFKLFYIFKSSLRNLRGLLKGLPVLFFMAFMAPRLLLAEFGSIVDIGLAGDFYFSQESANNGQAFANLLMKNTWSESQFWLDVGAGGLVGATAHSYIKAPQIYYRVGRKGQFNFTIGRRLNHWSYLDNQWNMGLIQPLFNWDTARPEKQGLTGLFAEIPLIEDKLQLVVFGSYLYLPTQGASYDLSNGDLNSSNPWFSAPVEAIALSGEKIDLNFAVNVPRAQDIVFRGSYGLQFGTPENKEGFLANAFYLNKPRNELVLPFEGALNLSTFQGDINVLPQVATHQVTGLDLGWTYSGGQIVLSWVKEFDIRYNIPQNTTYPILPDQDIYSLVTSFSLSKTQKIHVGYIYVDREETRVEGLFSSAQIDAYANRNRFEKAARISWEGLLAKITERYRIKTLLSYTQSFLRDNALISADIRWMAWQGMEFFNHCDFFGGSEKTIVGEDFISNFQNNDRCLIGGHYAF